MPPVHRLLRTSLPASVRVIDGEGALPCLDVATRTATARVFFHGAHVTQWTPAHAQEPVLWLSRHSNFLEDKAIRGGVPICFPWFGPHASERTAPAHGFARTSAWHLDDVQETSGDTVTLLFALDIEADTWPLWPHRCGVRYELSIGTTLAMTLRVENRSHQPFTFEEALHTYCAVSDVTQVAITGVEETEYLDKADGFARKRQGSLPIRFTGETDRAYLDTQATCRIDDPAGSRAITVSKSDSHSTVIWNPWAERALALPDFGNDEWRQMVCVETANIGAASIRLSPAASHAMRAEISTTSR